MSVGGPQEYTPQDWTCAHGERHSWDEPPDCDCKRIGMEALMNKLDEQRQPQWTTEQLLVNVVALLADIHAQLQRMNAAERTGSVSSVLVKFLAPTKDHPQGRPSPEVKRYTGSEPDVEQALLDYGHAYLLSEKALLEGWGATVEQLERRRVSG